MSIWRPASFPVVYLPWLFRSNEVFRIQTDALPKPCRSCSKLVLWCIWASGKRMPVDAEAVDHGDIVLTLRGGEYGELVASKLVPELHQGRRRFVSHFSTCKQAGTWRKKK